jgi:hypothetical protein
VRFAAKRLSGDDGGDGDRGGSSSSSSSFGLKKIYLLNIYFHLKSFSSHIFNIELKYVLNKQE